MSIHACVIVLIFFMLLFASSIQLFVCKLALNQCGNAILDQWMVLTWSGHPFILPLKTHNLRNDFPNWFPMKYKTVNSFLIMVWSWKTLNKIENWMLRMRLGWYGMVVSAFIETFCSAAKQMFITFNDHLCRHFREQQQLFLSIYSSVCLIQTLSD